MFKCDCKCVRKKLATIAITTTHLDYVDILLVIDRQYKINYVKSFARLL